VIADARAEWRSMPRWFRALMILATIAAALHVRDCDPQPHHQPADEVKP